MSNNIDDDQSMAHADDNNQEENEEVEDIEEEEVIEFSRIRNGRRHTPSSVRRGFQRTNRGTAQPPAPVQL